MTRLIALTLSTESRGLEPDTPADFFVRPASALRIALAMVDQSGFSHTFDTAGEFNAGRFPQFSPTPLYALVGARTVPAAWLIGTTAQAIAAFLLTRSAVRGFDVSIGRPIRTRGDAHHS